MGLVSLSRVKQKNSEIPEFVKKFGGQGRDRTGDTRIFSPLLYQLSYLATSYGASPSQNSSEHSPHHLGLGKW